jgi:hypothetical protein
MILSSTSLTLSSNEVSDETTDSLKIISLKGTTLNRKPANKEKIELLKEEKRQNLSKLKTTNLLPQYEVEREYKDYLMSHRTKMKIRRKVSNWVNARPNEAWRFIFVTLTLTDGKHQNSPEMNKLLNNFLTRMRQRYGNQLRYLWVAEIQEKETKNIHWHIIFDKPLPIETMKSIWLDTLENFGYPRYTKKLKLAHPIDLQYSYKYKDKDGVWHKRNPLKSVSSYITKYVSKNKTKLKCQLWNCSKHISAIPTAIEISANYLFLRKVFKRIFTKTFEVNGLKIISFYENKYIKHLLQPLYDFVLQIFSIQYKDFKNYAI